MGIKIFENMNQHNKTFRHYVSNISLKNLALTLLVFITFSTTKAQINQISKSNTVEQSIYGFQTGFFGAWFYNEQKLFSSFSLRTELGFDADIDGFFGLEATNATERNTWIAALSVQAEPRWYYNFKKRKRKGKVTQGNTGNFVAFRIGANFEDTFISNADNLFLPYQIRLIPTWGIRRQLGSSFNYEVGIGIGSVRIFDRRFEKWEGAINLHIRIGLDLSRK